MYHRTIASTAVLIALLAAAAPLDLHAQTDAKKPSAGTPLSYASEDPGGTKTLCEGYLVAKPTDTPVPGLLVVHDWMGPSDHYRRVAEAYAAHGMVVLMVDAYGKAVRPTSRKEAASAAGALKSNPVLFRARMRAALKALLATGHVDPKRVGAIGYCFGGTACLEAARDGAALAAVISVHGGLSTLKPAAKGVIKGQVLVLHGAADPHVKPAEVSAFIDEMRSAEVRDWQLIQYEGAVHGFSKPGKAHHPVAARRARAHALLLLSRCWKQPTAD